MKSREPIFGDNAKAFFIQAAVGVVVLVALNYFVKDAIGSFTRPFAHFIVGLFG